MAETIKVPALFASTRASPILQAQTKSNARSQQSKCRDAQKISDHNGITKRKQSKSRNGCVTCKARRLKCDERKPACQECKTRGVACGGYKKSFKWRPFEEPGCTIKQSTRSKKDKSNMASAQPASAHQSGLHDRYRDSTDATKPYGQTPSRLFIPDSYNSLHGLTVLGSSDALADKTYIVPMFSPSMMTPQSISPVESHALAFQGLEGLYGDDLLRAGRSELTAPSSVVAGQSPHLANLLLPGTDHCAPPKEYLSYRHQHEAFYQPADFTPPPRPHDDDVEEVPRRLGYSARSWPLRQSSLTPSNSSNSNSEPQYYQMPLDLQDSVSSPESILRRFHKDTCGVLSVKDGLTENPWRTLVWPLARDCPALYHAIASMTSFHQSSKSPPMRIQGIDHMHTAVQALAEGIQDMRFDAAISTTLVLAFAESWDVHIGTGFNHIKGAKALINQALMQHRQVPKRGEEWSRLKFLCNTWIYMDVIARLTSADDDESDDIDAIYDIIHSTGETEASLDPLMGCAQSLFPIIGRAATLVRRSQRPNLSRPDLVAQAMRVKSQLEQWAPPSYIENPKDKTTSPSDSLRTVAAYQYATLLYLHQAFPENPSLSGFALAKRALSELAAVEPSSRSCIVHVYPLMAAGCEMVEKNDRAWVVQRWELLLTRMKLGIIEKSLTVTKEVWARRDKYATECGIIQAICGDNSASHKSHKRKLDAYLDNNADVLWHEPGPKRTNLDSYAQSHILTSSPFQQECQGGGSSSNESIELLNPEFTVKSRLHWSGVMRDWNWEVLLG